MKRTTTGAPLDTYFSISSYGAPIVGAVYIFGGWRTPQLFYMPGVRAMVKLGYHVTLFVPNPKLISSNMEMTNIVDAADFASHSVAARIGQLPGRGKGLTLISMGASFGTLFATEVAKKNKRIKKLVISAPFGDFNEHVRLWEENKVFGPIISAQRSLVKDPAKILNQVGTIHDLSLLKGKEIYLSYSDRDVTVHTAVTEKFIDELRNRKLNVTVSRSRGGHYTGIYKNYASMMRSREFLA